MNNTDREKKKCNNQKLIGKKRFILIYGVLLWGVYGSLIFGILTIFFNPNPKNYNIASIVARFVSYAIIFGLGGIVVSMVQWNFKSKKYDNK
ncbi:hypothetical protein OXPF_18830 [Oxobacter pfennigii]|uniref:Uncharacterized protein n=1 Tax=Oxobacter pfennigii TaxID=36849 RepID=A0A0P8YCC6_9CLOT|nr:hypothetical protein [Oxobacter pfennigii]KPU44797.1 hypothetical protein OXPF_18830 [Oxobacter pfennigii]